jgi:hypothetical protein
VEANALLEETIMLMWENVKKNSRTPSNMILSQPYSQLRVISDKKAGKWPTPSFLRKFLRFPREPPSVS